MEKLEEGYSMRKTAKMFGIHFTTIEKWKRRGTLERKKRVVKRRKIDLDKLRADVEARPDDYLYERARRFGYTAEGIRMALKNIDITYKKNTKPPKSE